MDTTNILIIEDDESIRDSVKILLESEGFSVSEAPSGEQGLSMLEKDTDLVILDIMLPGMSGYKVCEEIRKKSVVPILFLTAKSTENDKVLGFARGGDDYLVKPFSYIELLARIKALLRRNTVYNNAFTHTERLSEEWVTHGNIKISTNKNEVFFDGKEITLTETEYQILLLLAGNPGKTYSVQELYESVWDELYRADSANTVMVHIRKLRTKIEKNPQEPQIVLTVWGKGYKIG